MKEGRKQVEKEQMTEEQRQVSADQSSRERAGGGLAQNLQPHHCIACGGELSSLMILEHMPASAQDIPTAEELGEDKPLTMKLCQCGSCGLVQFDTEPVLYYKDVIRAGGGSTTMRRLRHEEYRRLLAKLRERRIKGRNILEPGCGRGEFLAMWSDLYEDADDSEIREDVKTFTLRGVEHKAELVELGVQQGLNITQGFAEAGVQFPGAPFDAFVQFNFLEHQPKPKEMLRCIWENLKPGGLGLITVPSLEYILAHDGYYELIRDHIAYYTETSLQSLMQDCGFMVHESRLVNRDTIEMIVEKTDSEWTTQLRMGGGLLDVSSLEENYEQLKTDINEKLAQMADAQQSLAIWGASHQGFTLAATTELGGKVCYIIDSAPFKQGRYAPASHIPIVPPEHFFEEPVDEILIVAPGYTEEIAGIIRSRFGEQVRLSVLKSKRICPYVSQG